MVVRFKGAHFPQDIRPTGVRWYAAYALRTRHVEGLMRARGVHVDHSTVNRRVIKDSPQLEDAFDRRKRPVWGGGRMAETALKVKGEWRYLYRAVDTQGQTIDVLLTEPRDQEAARRHGVPEKMTIDGSEANDAAIKRDTEAHGTAIDIRQSKYLHNRVAQDLRAVTRITRPMLGCKSCAAAHATLVGIELMHTLKKRQLVIEAGGEGLTAAEQFDALAA